LGSVASAIGLLAVTLGDLDLAIANLERGAQLEARVGHHANAAHTQLWWAEALRSRNAAGDAQRARELLEQVAATAAQLGLTPVSERSATLLAES